MTILAAVKRMLAVPLRVGPRRRLGQVVIEGMRQRDPEAAMRELLQMDTDLQGAINQTALALGRGVHVKHRLMDYDHWFARKIQAGERVIDIGCGVGSVARRVAARGASVVAIDRNPQQTLHAARRWASSGVCWKVGTAPEDLDEVADVVILSNVLEHQADGVAFLYEIAARVHPSRWLIRVPLWSRDWRVAMRQELGLYAFSDPDHYREYTRESLTADLGEAGLANKSLEVNWGEIWATAMTE